MNVSTFIYIEIKYDTGYLKMKEISQIKNTIVCKN